MTTRGIEHFPQPENWTEHELKRLGYRRSSVSIFDHWLTRDEWPLNTFVSLERARAHGVEPAYHEQNRRLRDFYRCIFGKGAYRVTGSKCTPQVVWHGGWDRRLKKAVTAMVEDRRYGADFYAPAWHARVISGDARTDTLLLERNADESAIIGLASRHGLHIIA